MFKRYAYYERTGTGWCFVVYHDDKPSKSVSGADPERYGPFEVPQDMIDIDGTPRMSVIQRAFPNPFATPIPEPREEEDFEQDWPLPDWATGRAVEGVITVMQQLITKNADARGNATLAGIYGDGEQFLVVTDANNWIRYTKTELFEAYRPGRFILKEFPNPLSTTYFNDDRTF